MYTHIQGFSGETVIKKLPANAGHTRDVGLIPAFDPGLIPWRRKWQPTSVFLLGKFHRGAWWATVYGAVKSWT